MHRICHVIPAVNIQIDFMESLLSGGSFYRTSSHVLLPCQLVWQEAEVGMLDTSRNLRTPILTCARRFKRRAQVKIGGLWGVGV
jgi:hypothetical protein